VARVDRLTALRVQREKRPGRHPDGRGLFLCIGKSGARSWVLRFMLNGKSRDMGLGSAHDVTLAEARGKAASARKLKADGIDPVATKHASRAAARTAQAKAVTFGQCADAYLAAHRGGWRSVVHAEQWRQSIADYSLPVLGALPVAAIDTALVLKVLEPLWSTKTATASRVRNRVELILDWAKARGYRDGENPARWRGHLDKLLPAPTKVQRKTHHAALPHADLPAFVAELRAHKGHTARALEFVILTAARTGEVRGATAAEFDMAAAVWTIPAPRMKSGKEHRVPLSAPALALVDAAVALTSRVTMSKLVAKLRPGLTVHGFRSTFRDWAAETTNFPREIAELALAHTVGSEVERAYRRSDLFDRRRQLMNEWAAYCAGQGGSK
jgi:integrase